MRRILCRAGLLTIVAILVGALTVMAMPAKLPPELDFIYQLRPKIVDTPLRSGCLSADQEIYPSTTFFVEADASELRALFAENLTPSKGWYCREMEGTYIARLSPILHGKDGPHHSVEAVIYSDTPEDGRSIVVTDYRHPYGTVARWVITLRGK